MVIKQNKAYIGGAGKLVIEADDYTAAVTSFVLTPTTPTVTTRDIGGGVTVITGKPSWVAAIGYNQDWTTPDSFSAKLEEWAGTNKSATYTPASGGEGRTVLLAMAPGTFGGPSEGIHAATVNLGVNGQPTVVGPV